MYAPSLLETTVLLMPVAGFAKSAIYGLYPSVFIGHRVLLALMFVHFFNSINMARRKTLYIYVTWGVCLMSSHELELYRYHRNAVLY